MVSEDPLVQAAFASLLAEQATITLVESAEGADLVLVDAGVEPDRVLDRLADLAELGPPAIALIADAEHAQAALSRGVRGVVLRGTDRGRIAAALVAAHHGLTVIDARFTEAVVTQSAGLEPLESDLTARETEVLRLVADGLSNKRIAKKLAISEHTAKFHVNSILGKLDANTRTEAVVTAARRGLLLL